MSWQKLPTDYTDAVWDGRKKYKQITNSDGTISLDDVTVYHNKEKSFFGALDANRMNEALNVIMSMVENGTDLYTAFQEYFASQQNLYQLKVDQEYAAFVERLMELKDNGVVSVNELVRQATASATAAKASEAAAKSSETAAKSSEASSASSAKSAQTSATTANNAKSGAESARLAADTAKTNAQTAMSRAQQCVTDATNILSQTKQVSVRTPYVGTNGNWYTWDNTTSSYTDSGVQAQGKQGVTGAKGDKGDKGDPGNNGVALSAAGLFAFNVDAQGHLILLYSGDTAPDITLGTDGHLYWQY